MRAQGAALMLVFTQLGCNALTGVNDLQPLDCVDCVEDSGRDSSSPKDSGSVDTGPRDTGARDTFVGELDTAPPVDTVCTSDNGCDDGNACTADKCDVATGACTNSVIDADGDGESPTSLGSCGTDCEDGNPNVFSKQMAFFTTSYISSSGVPSFDYNCDGNPEKQYPALTVCTGTSSTTCMETVSGWATTVPACGQLAKRAVCIKVFGCARGTAEDATRQPCR